jgi:GNAT superfamily N-acetyltransferase
MNMGLIYEGTKNGYHISTDTGLLDIAIIHNYLANESYWAKNIPKETVEKSIKHSICFGVYFNKEQIGFARLITDKATFAYLADVFILEGHRNKGIAKFLMKVILDYPEIKEVRGILLRTKDAHELYKKLGGSRLVKNQLKDIWYVIFIKNIRHYPETNSATALFTFSKGNDLTIFFIVSFISSVQRLPILPS